jgi:hypothetical protein
LDAEDPPANGQGYPADGPPGNGVADDQFGSGGGPTIPLDRWMPDGDGAGGAYLRGGPVSNGNGHGLLSAGPDPAEAAEEYVFPEAAASSHGPGRWLRNLIGVDERLLDRVWEERARYTCLGAIVLGTATMAMLSMLDALDQVFGPIWPVLVLVALFWGGFICGIDRWLITSTHGARSGQWHVFLPRIFLALLFGVIIATPLVLTVFGSEVVSRAQNDQSNALLGYESKLKQCNPLPDASAVDIAAAQSPGCVQFRVPVGNPAIGTDQAISSEQVQRDQLNKLIASDNSQIANLNTIARDECNGVSGTGLSGVVGVGPNCNRDRQKADSFTRTSNVTLLQGEVTSLDNKIATQTITAGQQTQTYSANISTAVANLVAAKKQQEGRIGLLNRIDALDELASAHFVIAAATVLLAIFIIVIDCLPVLSKMMSGMTQYDKILEFRLKIAERMAADTLKVAERRATSRDEIELNRIESHMRSELERIDEASQFERAKRDAELDRKIAYLAAEYRRLADVEGGIA